jgi:hypothetical protein
MKKVAGAARWRAIWLKKVMFAEPADETKTRGEGVEFGTTTLEGSISEQSTALERGSHLRH